MPNAYDIPRRLKLSELKRREQMTTEELLETFAMESVVPALCSEGCEVEPDGRCPHGNPSFLLTLGLI